jgi:hypothetical protein
MLGNPKNVFWEALLLTVVVFFFGLLIGYSIEGSRLDTINQYYAESEVSLMDSLAISSLVDNGYANCSILILSNLDFADRVYSEAKILENYEAAGKLSDNLQIAHRKYDLLRTFLWMDSKKTLDKCKGGFSTVVYLYQQNTGDLAQKATQNVWSKVLGDLKSKKGADVVLIPIAVDSNLSSLNSLMAQYKITKFPVVVINDQVVYDLSSADQLEKYLK